MVRDRFNEVLVMSEDMDVLGWTPEREAALRRMWLDGLSGAQIALALGGGVTRNAVIGKVHRLQLHNADRAFVPPVQRPRAEAPARVPRAGGRGRRSAAEMLELARQHTRGSALLQRESPPGTADRRRGNGRTQAVAAARAASQNEGPFAADAASPDGERLLKSAVWLPLLGRTPVPLVELDKNDCKWPLGDPQEPGFGFCGLPREHEHTSYCAVHRRAATAG